MGEPPQRRFDAARDHRHARERLAGALAVDERRAIGLQADPPAGRIGVVVADLLVRGVVVDERVHVPRADREEQPRPAELPPRLARLPVRLAQDRDAKPRALEHAMQDRHREAGVIDVGIAGDEDDIDGVPSALAHLRRRRRRVRRREPLVPERQRQFVRTW